MTKDPFDPKNIFKPSVDFRPSYNFKPSYDFRPGGGFEQKSPLAKHMQDAQQKQQQASSGANRKGMSMVPAMTFNMNSPIGGMAQNQPMNPVASSPTNLVDANSDAGILALTKDLEEGNQAYEEAEGLAQGGTLDQNTPHLVGEEGPELIVPTGKGYQVIPADKTREIMAKGGANPKPHASGGYIEDYLKQGWGNPNQPLINTNVPAMPQKDVGAQMQGLVDQRYGASQPLVNTAGFRTDGRPEVVPNPPDLSHAQMVAKQGPEDPMGAAKLAARMGPEPTVPTSNAHELQNAFRENVDMVTAPFRAIGDAAAIMIPGAARAMMPNVSQAIPKAIQGAPGETVKPQIPSAPDMSYAHFSAKGGPEPAVPSGDIPRNLPPIPKGDADVPYMGPLGHQGSKIQSAGDVRNMIWGKDEAAMRQAALAPDPVSNPAASPLGGQINAATKPTSITSVSSMQPQRTVPERPTSVSGAASLPTTAVGPIGNPKQLSGDVQQKTPDLGYQPPSKLPIARGIPGVTPLGTRGTAQVLSSGYEGQPTPIGNEIARQQAAGAQGGQRPIQVIRGTRQTYADTNGRNGGFLQEYNTPGEAMRGMNLAEEIARQRLANQVAKADIEGQYKLLGELAKPEKPIIAKEGETAYDPRTLQPIGQLGAAGVPQGPQGPSGIPKQPMTPDAETAMNDIMASSGRDRLNKFAKLTPQMQQLIYSNMSPKQIGEFSVLLDKERNKSSK